MAEQSKTVDSALTLLTLLADEAAGSSAASLARTLELSRSAVVRPLATLEAHGLARRTGDGWCPGLGLLALAAGIEPRLRNLARGEMERLAARFGETVVLSMRDGDEVVAVDQVVGDAGVVQIHYRTGTRHPVGVAASGRVLLGVGPPRPTDRVSRRSRCRTTAAWVRSHPSATPSSARPTADCTPRS